MQGVSLLLPFIDSRQRRKPSDLPTTLACPRDASQPISVKSERNSIGAAIASFLRLAMLIISPAL
jgi:hypothetical protein